MTPEVLAALRRIVDELGADAGVLVRLSPAGSAVVTSSTLAPAVRVGDAWVGPGTLADPGGGPQLVLEPERLSALPTAARPVLAAPVTAALVAPVADTPSRLVLLYARSSPPPDVIGRLEAGSLGRLTLLAPLLDALRALRDRAVDPVAPAVESGGLLADPAATVRALAESEQRYRLLAENVSDVVVQGSADGTMVWVSPSVTPAMGWAPADLVGRPFRDIVHPDDLAEVVAGQERLARGEPIAFESRLRTAQGDHRWMSIRVKPLFDDEGRIIGRVAGWWDSRGAHEAMERLARSESRYRLLLENSNDVVFQASDGVLTWVSPAIEGVTGWRPDELVGGTTTHLWHPDDVEQMGVLRDGAYGGRHGRGVLRFRRADGQYLSMEVAVRPYRESDGRPGVVGMMHDVTERVLAQEAARSSEERYRIVAENASDVVCRFRADGIIDWVFGSTEALAGRTADELVGTLAASLFVTADLADRAEIGARLARGETVQSLARLRRPDGSPRWVDTRAKAVLAADGSVEYIISTWRDAHAEVEYRDALDASVRQARELADAYKAARNEAIEASTAKTAFLSRMSHELRTPLNAVLGFAQLLALDPLTAEQAEGVEHIRSGGRHLLDLINEILDISRIEAGRLALSMEPVDAGEVVAEALDLMRPLARQYRVSVAAPDGDGQGTSVHADRQRMRQVLINLVSNAVKYNRPGGSVRVGCRPGSSGEVVVEVSDTGPGIADELLPRLFQPFDRLGAESSGVEGTGIGLALADGLARAMGGRIDVVTRLGTGSTFTLVLRASSGTADRAVSAAPEPDLRHTGDLRILYVEDNTTNATLMARVVTLRPGCRLEVAADGTLGLAAALREPPGLVFLDLHLPDLPGDELLGRLRALPGCDGIPIVVVTADASPGARERMLGLGADGFLTKPFDLDDVLEWIDRSTSGPGAT